MTKNQYMAYVDTLAILLDNYQENDRKRVERCVNDLRFELKRNYIRNKK